MEIIGVYGIFRPTSLACASLRKSFTVPSNVTSTSSERPLNIVSCTRMDMALPVTSGHTLWQSSHLWIWRK